MIEYIRIAVLFAAGIYLSDRISAGFGVIFTISLFMVLTIQAVFKHKFNIKILIALVAFTTGVLLCRYSLSPERRDLYEYSDRYVTLEGRINQIPEIDEGNVQYTIDVRKVTYAGETEKVRENVLLTAASGFKYGDTVIMSDFLEDIPLKMNENGFDFDKYYKSKNIFYKIYSDNAELSSDTIRDYSPYALGMYVKSYVCNLIDNIYSGDYGAIMKAVLTGNKKEFSDDFDKILVRTGLKRFYYPAFVHVMLFMSVIAFVLSAFGRRKRDMITVFLLIIYASVNFSNAVFLKLSIMMALLIFLKSRFGHVYYLDVIGMTAIIMGLINPLVYFDTGFIMSMLSSILIYYFYDTVYGKLEFIKVKYIRRVTAIGLICTVGLIPVTAYFFNDVSFYSLLVSFIMLPCVSLLLILSPLLILLWSIFGAAPVIKQASSCMLFILKYIPIWADKFRFLHISLPKTRTLFLIIYLFIMIAAVKYIKDKKLHARIALLVAAALTVSMAAVEIERFNDLEITFVNVGQGDGALIRAPYRFNVLIDGGGGTAYSDYNPGEKVYLEYLKTEGITEVDSAFVSHYHQDHVQGIIAALENIKVRNLFLPDNMEGSEWRKELENAAHERGTKIHYMSEETLITYNNGMTIHAIPPAATTAISDDENDTSYVYQVEYGGFSSMFTGDMSVFAEKCLLNIGRVPHADLLKVSHHGSRTATSKEWVEAVSPKYAVISLGEDNSYGFPNKEVLENLTDMEIYRTDYDGDIRFILEKDGRVEIETFNRRE
ncbi:MAG: ComEC/Rec2 family competence protein [Oscillospiraceae bacterium]|nr:ComEC/Rec2 family competence protein [Oscillospiraceae bacterium]